MDTVASRFNLLLLFLVFLQVINRDTVQLMLDSPRIQSQEQDLIMQGMTFSEQNYQNMRQNNRGITFGGSQGGGLFSFINKPKTMTNSSISKENVQQGKVLTTSNQTQNGTNHFLAPEVNQKGQSKNGQQTNDQSSNLEKNDYAYHNLQTNGINTNAINTSSNFLQNTEQFSGRKNLEKSLTAKFGSPKLVFQQNQSELDEINLMENNNEDNIKSENTNGDFINSKVYQEYTKQRKKSNFQMYATQENSKENHEETENKQNQKPNKNHQDLQTSVMSPDFPQNKKVNKNNKETSILNQNQNSKMIDQANKQLQEIKLFRAVGKDEENYSILNQTQQNYQSLEYQKKGQISSSPKSILSNELSQSPLLQLSVPNNSQFYQMFFQILPEGILLLGSKQNKVHVQNRMLERLMNSKGGFLIDKFFKLENNLNLGETSETSGTLDILPMIMNMKTILNDSTSQQRISSIQQLNQNMISNQLQTFDSKTITQPSQFQPKPQAGSDNDERTNTQGSNNQIPSMPNVSILQSQTQQNLEDPKFNQQINFQSLQNSPVSGQQQHQIDESILSKSNLKYIPQPIRQNMNQKQNGNVNNNNINRKEKDLADEQITRQIDQQRSQFNNDILKEYSNSLSSNLNQSNLTQNNIDVTYSRKKTIGELYRSLIKEIQQDIEMHGSASKYEAFEHQLKMICSFPYIKKKRTSNSNLKSQFNISQMAYSNNNLNNQSVSNAKSDTSDNVENCKKIFEVTCIPCIIESQPSVLFVVKDVTHFNQIKLLKHINKNKSQMLSQVAHEFRTPLNCIISMMELASITNPSSQIQQYLKPALTSAKQLNSMVNDLLDLAQVKAGKFSLNMESFNLQELISQIVLLMSFQSDQKGLALIPNIDPQIPNQIYSDPNRLRQIIINLVGNSLKFTKKGSITIKASLLNAKLIRISIIDTGIGIKEEDMANLFQAFGKIVGQEQKQLNPNGVGLGLMISHVLAKNLGEGEGLKVESQVGVGTEFYFEIVNNLQKMNIDKSFILKSQIVKSQYYKKSQITSMKIDQHAQQQQHQQLQYQQHQFIQKPQNHAIINEEIKVAIQNQNNFKFDEILKTFGKIESQKELNGQENKLNKQEEQKENGLQQQTQKRKCSIQVLHNSSKLKSQSIPSQNAISTPKSNSCNFLANSMEDHQPEFNAQANLSVSASLNQMLNIKQTRNQIITIHEEDGEYEGDGSANFYIEESFKNEEGDQLIKNNNKSIFSNPKNQFHCKDQIGPKVQLIRCHVRNESIDYDGGLGESVGFLSDRPYHQNVSDGENKRNSIETTQFQYKKKQLDISDLLNQNQNNHVVLSNIQKLQVQQQLDNLISKKLNNVDDLHDSSSDEKDSSVAEDENLNDSLANNFQATQNNSGEQKQPDDTQNQNQPDINSDKNGIKKRTQKRYKTKIKRSSSQVEFFESSHKSVSQSLSASVQAEVEILTIDDNDFNNMVLKMHIERLIRARVHCAIDAHDALSKLQEQYSKTKSGFDLIFLDLSMPEIDGYGTFNMIKNFCNEKRITQNVVACTGYSNLEEKDKCIDHGMVDYILKPIEISKLKEVLSIFLDINTFNK